MAFIRVSIFYQRKWGGGPGGWGLPFFKQKRNLNMRADPEKFSKKEDPRGYLFAGVSETYFP